jgi:HSP20 family protein
MALFNRSQWPSQLSGSRLSNFFSDTQFVDSAWLKQQPVRAVKVRDNEKMYEIELTAPGFQKHDFKITVSSRHLYVSASSEGIDGPSKSNASNEALRQRSFVKSFHLPIEISLEQIKTRYASGKLKITIAKRPVSRKRKPAPKQEATSVT